MVVTKSLNSNFPFPKLSAHLITQLRQRGKTIPFHPLMPTMCLWPILPSRRHHRCTRRSRTHFASVGIHHISPRCIRILHRHAPIKLQLINWSHRRTNLYIKIGSLLNGKRWSHQGNMDQVDVEGKGTENQIQHHCALRQLRIPTHNTSQALANYPRRLSIWLHL